MEAIVEIQGFQFRVHPDDTIFVPRLQEEPGSTVEFDRILYLRDGEKIAVGTPYVSGTVRATVIEHGKGEKVIVFKKKRHKGYRVKNGHRQPYTQIKIEAIEVSQ